MTSAHNSDPDQPITIDHIIASGSLPPSYPPKRIDNRSYWDGGLFDNTPLSQLLNQISVDDAAVTRVIVINLFPNRGAIPKTMINVWDRMVEIQFSNKTKKDVALAQKINKLIAALERLQGVPAHHADSLTQLPELPTWPNIRYSTILLRSPITRPKRSRARQISRRRASIAELPQVIVIPRSP